MTENYVDLNKYSWVIGGVTFEDGFLKDLKVSGAVASQLPPEFELDSSNTYDDLFVKYATEIARVGNQYVGDKLSVGIDGRAIAQTVNDLTFIPLAPAVFYNAGISSTYGVTAYNVMHRVNAQFIGNYLLKRAGARLDLAVTFPSGGVQIFTITLSNLINDNAVITAGRLSIIADEDPFAVGSVNSGIYRAILIRLNNGSLSTNAVAIPRYTFALTITEGTSIRTATPVKFYYDDYTNAQIVSATIDSETNNAGTWVYISGVPRLPPGATLGFTIVGRFFVKLFYNLTQLWRVIGSGIVEKVRAPSSDIVGAAYAAPLDAVTDSSTLVVAANAYVPDIESALTVRLYNASGDYVSSALVVQLVRQGDLAAVTALSIDTLSQAGGAESSRRVLSGLGPFPNTGYGGTYVSTQSLAANEELQLLGAQYTYPLINYSATSPAGPDYSDVGIRATSYLGFRWATFAVTIPDPYYISRGLITISGIVGDFPALVDSGDILIYIKVNTIAYWLSATSGYDPSQGDAFLDNGNGIAEYGIYDDSIVSGNYLIPITLGHSYQAESVLVRVGIKYNTNGVAFTNATLSVVSQ